MPDIIANYLNKGTLLGFLFSFLVSLLAAKYKEKIWRFLKIKRVWSRAVVLVIIICIWLLFYDDTSLESHYPIVIVFIVSITLILWTAFLPLLHENFIIEHCENLQKYKMWMWTTQAKIKFEYKCISLAEGKEKPTSYCKFLKFLNSVDLYAWEVEDYYFYTLEKILQLGAIKQVSDGLEKYRRDFSQSNNWMLLQSYVAYYVLDLTTMERILHELEKRRNISKEDILIMQLNIICAANECSNREIYCKYIKLVEKTVVQEGIYNDVALSDLVFYYDEQNEVEKSNAIIEIIKNKDYKKLNEFLAYYDIIFQHYKKIGDRQQEADMLIYIIKRGQELSTNEEERSFVQIRMLARLLDINVGWKEYSAELFAKHEYYLNLSFNVAITYISEVLCNLRNVQNIYNMHISQPAYDDLSDAILKAIKIREPELIAELNNTPKELLYKRKDLYMHLVDMVSFRLDQEQDLAMAEKEKLRIIGLIIQDCEDNNNIRERLHFINVYCDEILTVHEQMRLYKESADVNYKDYETSYESFLKPLALERLQEMEKLIKDNINNKSLNYYVLYTSYLYGLCDNTKKQEFYFQLFEDYGIDPRYFNAQTQKLYRDLKRKIRSNQQNG